MADRPILFSGPMVRALLDGQKTQTRRLATNQNVRRIEIGDRLYVRETWTATFWTPEDIDGPPREFWATPRDERTKDQMSDIYFRATEEVRPHGLGFVPEKQWTPGIHMPRWASRLTLGVTGKQTHALRTIHETDAIAEGVFPQLARSDHEADGRPWVSREGGRRFGLPHEAFADLWDEINPVHPWASNPDVVALTFTVHRCNIDDMPAA
jgi:hypothetical protein